MGFNDYLENELTSREKMMLEVVQKMYRKHHMGDESIAWEELGDEMQVVLAEVMGDESYEIWIDKMKFEIEHPTYPKSERGA